MGVEMLAVCLGERKRDDWTHDAWAITFTRTPGNIAEDFDYCTGTGHRKSKRPMPADIARLRPNILARVEWERYNLKPVRPDEAGVLHSLVMDAQADDMSFSNWCDDYGYDTDSRKALATYEACCECAKKLRRLFSRAEIEALRELLQDY
jgi:hypothetical protein